MVVHPVPPLPSALCGSGATGRLGRPDLSSGPAQLTCVDSLPPALTPLPLRWARFLSDEGANSLQATLNQLTGFNSILFWGGGGGLLSGDFSINGQALGFQGQHTTSFLGFSAYSS